MPDPKSKSSLTTSGGFILGASPHKTGEIEGGSVDMNKILVRKDADPISQFEANLNYTPPMGGRASGSGQISNLAGTYTTKALDKLADRIDKSDRGAMRDSMIEAWKKKKEEITTTVKAQKNIEE